MEAHLKWTTTKNSQLTVNGKQTSKLTRPAYLNLKECCLPPTINFFVLLSRFETCFLSTGEENLNGTSVQIKKKKEKKKKKKKKKEASC